MKTLQFGVIGVGRFGKHYVRLLSDWPAASLKATANNSAEALQLIQDKAIDCVIIATPSSTHCKLIVAALEAGKHVLVEKPMVTGEEEARAVRVALAGKPLTLMVGFQFVYNDYIRYLKQIMEEGRLGKILYVLGEQLYPGPIRCDVGCFVDAGAHELSILHYLFNPGTVTRAVGQSLAFGATEHDDCTAVTVNFERGLTAHLVTSRIFPQKTRRLIIIGQSATAVFDDVGVGPKLQIFERPYPSAKEPSSTKSIFLENKPPIIPQISASEPLKSELEHFIHCVQTGESPITNAEFGSWVVEQSEIILKNVQRV